MYFASSNLLSSLPLAQTLASNDLAWDASRVRVCSFARSVDAQPPGWLPVCKTLEPASISGRQNPPLVCVPSVS